MHSVGTVRSRTQATELVSVTIVVVMLNVYIKKKQKHPLAGARAQTIPTERPPLVGEVIANLCG
jgi:hypothetical protein